MERHDFLGNSVTARSFPRKTSGPRRRPRILVAGLGNLLLKDDGVGVHAVRALQGGVPRGVRAVEVGTAVLDALHLLEWADHVLAIDAMQAGGDPGTIYRFGVEDVAEAAVKASLHEVDLLAALRFLTSGHRPEIAVLGVEPETIEAGLDLTPSVQAALPRVVAAARDIVAGWRD
jgi:hydrogenase maturation protease